MSSTVLIFLVVVPGVFISVLLLGLLVLSGAARRSTTGVMPPQTALVPEVGARVRELIGAGKKIEAIKVVRQHTALGLKDAKDLVDAMAAGYAVPAAAPGMPGPPGGRDRMVDRETRAGAEELIAKGELIKAIKLVRERTGLGLKEAKNYCEAVRDGRLPPAASLSERVRTMLAAGDRAGAAALVRAETGMTESEAESFVDALT